MVNLKRDYPNFLTVDDVLNLGKDEIVANQKKFQNHLKVKLAEETGAGNLYLKMNGTKMIDDEGNEFLDMVGSVGVYTVGNNNDYVWDAISKARHLPTMHQVRYNRTASSLAKNLATLSPGALSKVWFGTGGSEANEGAIKLCRMSFKGGRHKLVSNLNSFHGKTTGSISLTGREKWKIHQSPLLPGVSHVPFGDADALEEALQFSDVAAFFVEPIQGEGGVVVPPKGYLKEVREICTKYGTLMVADEIQTGFGRTGKLWAVEHDDVVPDVITFGKGISGGFIPLSGYITTEDIWNRAYGSMETFFHHNVSYGDNALGCVAGIAALTYILENDLLNKTDEKGKYIRDYLKKMQEKYPKIIKEVRGKGLLIGMEFNISDAHMESLESGKRIERNEMFAFKVATTMMIKHRVSVLTTSNNPVILRMLPPLDVSYDDIDFCLDCLEKTVEEIAGQL